MRNNAWGHHASCSCKIGSEAESGVLDSNFRVHGVTGLRVVDASIFPKIPGFFIVSSIYMAGEKAADVIHADAKRNEPAQITAATALRRGVSRAAMTTRSGRSDRYRRAVAIAISEVPPTRSSELGEPSASITGRVSWRGPR